MSNERTLYLFVDKLAFDRLCAQPECIAEAENAVVTGYETYLVEEWALERRSNVCISSFTGNETHKTEVQIVSVPGNVDLWSLETRKTFEELASLGVHPQETPLGNMLIASLSSFPSNLTLISMLQKFTEGYSLFLVNENLRRLGVVSRIAVTCAPPSDAAVATLRKNFAVNQKVTPSFAALEIVTLVQISLFYFDLFDPEHVDGLFCNKTLTSAVDWWTLFGQHRFPNAAPRPEDKMYMKISTCALLGVVIGARQRLSALGLKPHKDPFNCIEFVKCIKRFQKLVKLERTEKLDSSTYFKLIQETSKIGSFSGGTVLNAMKSTVKEGFSGKAAGAVDDWETLDIETLAENAKGHRCKYLFQGKGEPNVLHCDSQFANRSKSRLLIPLFSLPVDQFHEISMPEPEQHRHHRPSFRSHGIHQILLRHEKENKEKENEEKGETQFKQIENADDGDSEFKDSRECRDSRGENERDPNRLSVVDDEISMATNRSSRSNKSHRSMKSSESNLMNNRSSSLSPSAALNPKQMIKILCTKDDNHLERIVDRPLRPRAGSLNEVHDVVFPFKPLFSLPRILALRESAGNTQKMAKTSVKDLQTTEQKLRDKTRTLDNLVKDIMNDNNTISYHSRTIQRRTSTITQRFMDLEALTARIDYEMAMLKVKIRDADQSVRAFSNKIETFDKKFREMK